MPYVDPVSGKQISWKKMGANMLNQKDVQVLRELAQKYAEIAALPVQTEKRRRWVEHNEFRNARPMVLIDQICWGRSTE